MSAVLILFLSLFGAVAKADLVPAPPWPAIPGSPGETLTANLNLQRLDTDQQMLAFDDQLTCAASLIAKRQVCLLAGVEAAAKLCGSKHDKIALVMACGSMEFDEAVSLWMKTDQTRKIFDDNLYKSIGAARIGNLWVAVLGDRLE